jgi:hypothetical protein
MKSETNFWGSFAFAGRSLYVQSTLRTLADTSCLPSARSQRSV